MSEIKINATVILKLACCKCGNMLYVAGQKGDELRIDPCSICLAEERGKGVDDGYTEAWNRHVKPKPEPKPKPKDDAV